MEAVSGRRGRTGATGAGQLRIRRRGVLLRLFVRRVGGFGLGCALGPLFRQPRRLRLRIRRGLMQAAATLMRLLGVPATCLGGLLGLGQGRSKLGVTFPLFLCLRRRCLCLGCRFPLASGFRLLVLHVASSFGRCARQFGEVAQLRQRLRHVIAPRPVVVRRKVIQLIAHARLLLLDLSLFLVESALDLLNGGDLRLRVVDLLQARFQPRTLGLCSPCPLGGFPHCGQGSGRLLRHHRSLIRAPLGRLCARGQLLQVRFRVFRASICFLLELRSRLPHLSQRPKGPFAHGLQVVGRPHLAQDLAPLRRGVLREKPCKAALGQDDGSQEGVAVQSDQLFDPIVNQPDLLHLLQRLAVLVHALQLGSRLPDLVLSVPTQRPDNLPFVPRHAKAQHDAQLFRRVVHQIGLSPKAGLAVEGVGDRL